MTDKPNNTIEKQKARIEELEGTINTLQNRQTIDSAIIDKQRDKIEELEGRVKSALEHMNKYHEGEEKDGACHICRAIGILEGIK
jgi:predicted RNase H-like nuclease (RuvC/YqgF family)